MSRVFKDLFPAMFTLLFAVGCGGGAAESVTTTSSPTPLMQTTATSITTPATVQTTTTTKPAPTNNKPKSSSTTLKPIADVDALFEKLFSELQTADRAFMDTGNLVTFDRSFGKIKNRYKSLGVTFGVDSYKDEAIKYTVNVRGTRKCRIQDLSTIIPTLIPVDC